MMTYDALVVGGGPAGSTAAILLAREGWSVAIVEKSVFPRRKVCGEFVSASNMPVLDELGIGPDFRGMAGPEIRRVGLFARGSATDAPMPEMTSHADGWGRALGRERLDLLLLEQATRAGVQVWQPYRVMRVYDSNGSPTCHVAAAGRERVLRARVVIEANGSSEPFPASRSSRTPFYPSDLIAFKANFTDCGLPTDLMPLLAFPGGYGGMITRDGAQVCLSCCIRRDMLSGCRKQYPHLRAGDAVLKHIQRTTSGAREALTGSQRIGAWLAYGPVRPGIRQEDTPGRFRVGNAAGEAHPIIAEGISLAVQSSYLLAKHLVAQQDLAGGKRQLRSAARAYRRAWKTSFATRVRASRLFAQLAMNREASLLLSPVLERYPKMLTIGAALSGKTRASEPA